MDQNTDISHALIFIPDISGFTSFINEVEIEHSTHIISELLEIIIDSNRIQLEISEIEGDAILFYKKGEIHSAKKIKEQAEIMFLNFSEHLANYETKRICQCGACSTAYKLSLKFIAHKGFLTERVISTHQKLFGPDITLAHKLLKNGIKENEYLLFSSAFNIENEAVFFKTEPLLMGSYNYNGVGKVDFNYLSLEEIKPKLPEIQRPQLDLSQFKKPIRVSKNIHASITKVQQFVSNVSLKPKWILGLKSVKKESETLDVIGSKHLCIMPTQTLNFEVIANEIKEREITYIEKTDSMKLLGTMMLEFLLKKISVYETVISINIYYKKNQLTKLFFDIPLRLMMLIIASISLYKLKKQIENA